MKTHTTNYHNSFIKMADDCPATSGEIPATKGDKKTAAAIQYELISENPYQYNSDDVLFRSFAIKNEIPAKDMETARREFFSKGQPCFRASALTKRYGWGIHNDENGKIALYGCETEAYKRFAQDTNLKVIKAMRSGK